MTNMTAHVAQLVHDAGRPVSGDDLLPLCPGLTRKQVLQALQTARAFGYVVVVQRGGHKGIGMGTTPGLYGPTGKLPAVKQPHGERDLPDTPPLRVRGQFGIGRVASIWGFAQGVEIVNRRAA